MKYNQPLDQPSNPNAGYNDGNPSSGILGSIIPAASIEYDQREVVEVINQANARGYSDFSGAACAAPSNSDTTQLRKAIEGYIQSWVISTNVTFTVHGTGANFADLNAAFAYLSKYRITQTGKVTLQIAGASSGVAAQYVYTTPVIIYHPNIDRIFITGANLIGSPPVGTDFQYTGNLSADRTNQLSMLRTRYGTELRFTAGAYLQINGSLGALFGAIGGAFGIQNLLITSDGLATVQGNGGINFNNAYASLGNISVHGFANDGIVVNHGYVWTEGNSVSSSGNLSNGIEFQGWFALGAGQTICCSNSGNGILLQPGTAIRGGGNYYGKGNVGAGLYAFLGSSAAIQSSQFISNGQYGVYAAGAQVDVRNSAFSGNGTAPIFAAAGAGVYVTGTTGTSGSIPAVGAAPSSGQAYAWIAIV